MYLFLRSGHAGATAKTPAPGAPDIEEENLMKNPGKWMFALSIGVFAGSAALADGYKNCTKVSKASWKPATEAEAQAKAAATKFGAPRSRGPATKFTASMKASSTSCFTILKTSA